MERKIKNLSAPAPMAAAARELVRADPTLRSDPTLTRRYWTPVPQAPAPGRSPSRLMAPMCPARQLWRFRSGHFNREIWFAENQRWHSYKLHPYGGFSGFQCVGGSDPAGRRHISDWKLGNSVGLRRWFRSIDVSMAEELEQIRRASCRE